MQNKHTIFLILVICILLAIIVSRRPESETSFDQLAVDFASPPDSAKPWVYWFVMDGNLDPDGITADFEALKSVGIGGIVFMEVDVGIPKGPVKFMSSQWREYFKHINEEASRLGLVITMPASPGWTGSGGPWVKPEQSMQKLVTSEINLTGGQLFDGILPKPETVADFYRDIAVLAFPVLKKPYSIEDIQEKALFFRGWYSSQRGVKSLIPLPGVYPDLEQEQVIPMDDILDLTGKLDASGRLTWDVPEGEWTVLRFGHTSTGQLTRPAPEPGLGLECDKFDKAALEAHFDAFIGKLLADIGPLVGKSLISLHIDSWEMGPQNWTAGFRNEFRKRRGYDLLFYLPVMTGRVVKSLEVSERFLWDFRQTVLELIVANHARHLADLARRNGLGLSIEPYDQTPCDDMTYGACADRPMGEFWRDTFVTWFSCTEASSIAHTYGKPIVQAEAFTAGDVEQWKAHPAQLKTLGDWAFCEGINRFAIHRYAHQAWLDRWPGMTMGPWGIHYERTQTWWDMSKAWIAYLTRCQFLLQQGLFVADVCFLKPEASPQVFRPPTSATRGYPPERLGYNFDGCNAEVLITRMSVKNGRIMLPDGMSYRVLVLPEMHTMTPALLRKLKELVSGGATVIGPRPQSSPSLSGYPECDAEVIRLADELWGDCDGESTTERSYGKGRIIWHRSIPADLDEPPAHPLRPATWIWHNEGDPADSAPVSSRFFRRLWSLDPDADIQSARLYMTADNAFEIWVNGKSIDNGADHHKVFEMDLKNQLKPGTNIIAVEAENQGTGSNPAGLIGKLEMTSRDGRQLIIPTDRTWQTAEKVRPGWTTETVSSEGWEAALELGPFGMDPWGTVGNFRQQPDFYCDFGIVTGVLKEMGELPDFQSEGPFRYIHRQAEDTDIYFVANREESWQAAQCAFRVTGKIPEIWDPLTGEIKQQALYHEKDGRTFLPLCLEPAGSRFVVFRDAEPPARAGSGADPVKVLTRNGRDILPVDGNKTNQPPDVVLFVDRDSRLIMVASKTGRYELETASGKTASIDLDDVPVPQNIPGPWEVRFQPDRGAPEKIQLDKLIDLSEHDDPGVRYFSGKARYRTTFSWKPEEIANSGLQDSVSGSQPQYFLELGDVHVMARVNLNGRELGILWKKPTSADITDALKPGDNILEITVANLWPNRLIGDQFLPPEERVAWSTWYPYKTNTPLLESGLVGPVSLKTAIKVTLRPGNFPSR